MDEEFIDTTKERIESLENITDQLSLENRDLDIRLIKIEDKE